MAEAKKFIQVAGLSKVFALKSGVTEAKKASDFNASTIIDSIKAANVGIENSILFIHDETFGNWIWAKGQLYGADSEFAKKIGATATGDSWVSLSATTTTDDAGKVTIGVSAEHADVTRGDAQGTSTVLANGASFSVVTGVSSDAKGHLTGVVVTPMTLPTVGGTGNIIVSNANGAITVKHNPVLGTGATYEVTKTVDAGTVTFVTPKFTFDADGHLTGQTQKDITLTAADLGLDKAWRIKGVVQASDDHPKDGGTQKPASIYPGTAAPAEGDVVIDGAKEYVWTSDGKWALFGTTDGSIVSIGGTGDAWIGVSGSLEAGVYNFTVTHGGPSTKDASKSKAAGDKEYISGVDVDAHGHVVAVGASTFAATDLSAAGETGGYKLSASGVGGEGTGVSYRYSGGLTAVVTDGVVNIGTTGLAQAADIKIGVSASEVSGADIFVGNTSSINLHGVSGIAVTTSATTGVIVGISGAVVSMSGTGSTNSASIALGDHGTGSVAVTGESGVNVRYDETKGIVVGVEGGAVSLGVGGAGENPEISLRGQGTGSIAIKGVSGIVATRGTGELITVGLGSGAVTGNAAYTNGTEIGSLVVNGATAAVYKAPELHSTLAGSLDALTGVTGAHADFSVGNINAAGNDFADYTKAQTLKIGSADNSIKVSVNATSKAVVVDYTGIATADDWDAIA